MGFIKRRGQLGDYNDGQHTWHFDQAAGVYIDETGRTAEQQTRQMQAAAQPSTYTYHAADNPFLYADPTGQGIDGSTQHFNGNFYATPAAAAQFAAALGGQVVNDPTAKNFDQAQPMLAIRLPNGTVVNAGAIAQILENDANGANDNADSGLLAQLFGMAYRPGIAEALKAGTPIHLTAPSPTQSTTTPALTPTAAATPAATSAVVTAWTAPIVAALPAPVASIVSTLPSWALPAAVGGLLLLLRR